MPNTRTPVPGVMKFTILVDPSTIYLLCLFYALEKKSRFFKNDAFSHYNLNGNAPAQEPLPRGS